jgi:hypothetical protein
VIAMPGRWIALLGCGHEARLPSEPRPGDWFTCTSLKCQRQVQVVSVSAARQVPEPGEIGVQGELWTDVAA